MMKRIDIIKKRAKLRKSSAGGAGVVKLIYKELRRKVRILGLIPASNKKTDLLRVLEINGH